jgi:hypothetical protein
MTKLDKVRDPTRAERKRGAEVVFERSEGKQQYTVLGAKCYEGWEQWGAHSEVLSDNVPTIERWRAFQEEIME